MFRKQHWLRTKTKKLLILCKIACCAWVEAALLYLPENTAWFFFLTIVTCGFGKEVTELTQVNVCEIITFILKIGANKKS